MKSREEAGPLTAPAPAAADDAPVAGLATAAQAGPAESGTAVAAGSPGVPGPVAGAPGWTTALAVLLALLLAGLVAGGIFLARARHFDDLTASRQAAVAAARKAVADLTTADYRQPQQYAARLRGDATGSFLRLFTNSATGFRAVLAQGRVQTTGHAAYVGVQQAGPGRMQLSVLAYVTVRNSQAPSGAQRTYRLSVTMVPAGSRWLISQVEFVR